MKYIKKFRLLGKALIFITILGISFNALATDLDEIKKSGVLRHLGIPYANFVTGSGNGLDIELIRGFAAYLGVQYQFVQTDWARIFGDLNGIHAKRGDNGAELLDSTPIKGDIIANGMTILPWRQELVDFSDPTFPSAVWLISRADAPLKPITPTGSLQKDISLVKESMADHSVLGLENTCLDPMLYRLSETKARIQLADSKLNLNEMAPAVINNMAETTLLDVPDALIALEKWPGQLKVIGPVSEKQSMGAAFRKNSPQLRAAFNAYLSEIRANGTYRHMVKKYYPSVFLYYEDFFKDQ